MESLPRRARGTSPHNRARRERLRVATLRRRQRWLRESLARHPESTSSSYLKAELSALSWALGVINEYRPDLFRSSTNQGVSASWAPPEEETV